jgi:hypothetical protein
MLKAYHIYSVPRIWPVNYFCLIAWGNV